MVPCCEYLTDFDFLINILKNLQNKKANELGNLL